MRILNTKHQRKSAIITISILVLLLVAIFNFGMQYLDPPAEYGIAINFGEDTVGYQNSAPKKIASSPQKTTQEVVKKVQEQPKEKNTEDILTNETQKEVPVVEKQEEIVEEVEKNIAPKEVVKETPKPSKEAQDAFNNLLKNNTKTNESKGKGDDEIEGEKGEKKGDSNTNKYYKKSGDSNDENYNLAGRKALSKPIEKPDCQQEGIVVVSITVDKNGKVIAADPGVKGTTNRAQCLLKPAKEAALKTTWNVDKNAPVNQKGTIIYKFTLAK